MSHTPFLSRAALACLAGFFTAPLPQARGEAVEEPSAIKSYCLDFNWAPTQRRGKPFAKPGRWAGADPAEHVEWYKTLGANVIQTFCVSTNGYAWYQDGFVPAQPGLKHDFLPEVVKLGHQQGMQVMGYFCIAANPRWTELHPELSYGSPTTYHIPYTDAYLDYLAKSIGDAVSRTGIDGFMIDWVWMPKRQSTNGKWLDCEKKLYQQLMGEPFPGEDQLTAAQDTAYSRKAIDRCWKTIRKAAIEANPDCVIWLTVNKINHPHVVDSDMYREADWLMNEAGSLAAIRKVEDMVGERTRLITCMALWNGQDASVAVPEAMDAGIGLYGFTAPHNNAGLVPLDRIFSRQVSELSGDDRNLAVLARAYHGGSLHAEWRDGRFVEPGVPPPFRVAFKGRGRGLQDTATISHEPGRASVTVWSPYGKGRGQLVRSGADWPASLVIRLQRKPGEAAKSTRIRIANGTLGMSSDLAATGEATLGALAGRMELGREWKDDFLKSDDARPSKVEVTRNGELLEITVPQALTTDRPEALVFEWK